MLVVVADQIVSAHHVAIAAQDVQQSLRDDAPARWWSCCRWCRRSTVTPGCRARTTRDQGRAWPARSVAVPASWRSRTHRVRSFVDRSSAALRFVGAGASTSAVQGFADVTRSVHDWRSDSAKRTQSAASPLGCASVQSITRTVARASVSASPIRCIMRPAVVGHRSAPRRQRRSSALIGVAPLTPFHPPYRSRGEAALRAGRGDSPADLADRPRRSGAAGRSGHNPATPARLAPTSSAAVRSAPASVAPVRSTLPRFAPEREVVVSRAVTFAHGAIAYHPAERDQGRSAFRHATHALRTPQGRNRVSPHTDR